ncbi:MAG: hypothetical protein GX300_00870 [Tissierellia bacterium]|nr:hypothetical protein [Tissierellia bacterium]
MKRKELYYEKNNVDFIVDCIINRICSLWVAGDELSVSSTIIKTEDDIKTINLILPNFSGFNGAEKLNERILNIGLDAIGDANATAKSMKKYKEELEEAVSMYAEAVRERNGIVQYGLMADSLREESYGQFKDMGFVTGTSSPWVDNYEISQLGEKVYQIEFTLKTSVPTDSLRSIVKIQLIEDGQYISIRELEEEFK